MVFDKFVIAIKKFLGSKPSCFFKIFYAERFKEALAKVLGLFKIKGPEYIIFCVYMSDNTAKNGSALNNVTVAIVSKLVHNA